MRRSSRCLPVRTHRSKNGAAGLAGVYPRAYGGDTTVQGSMNAAVGSIDHISQVISQVVAPSFLLAAVTALISMLFTRMDVTLNRVRELNAIADTDLARAALKQTIPRLRRRVTLMHRSILLAIFSGIATTLLIITAFAVAILGFQPVSYTHLDVYKRQPWYRPAGHRR